LGQRVIDKIIRIIDEEMSRIGKFNFSFFDMGLIFCKTSKFFSSIYLRSSKTDDANTSVLRAMEDNRALGINWNGGTSHYE
jgi:hypothetical protein